MTPLLTISLDILRIFGQRDGQGGKAKTVPSLLAQAAALYPHSRVALCRGSAMAAPEDLRVAGWMVP